MNGIVRRYNDRRGFGFIEGLTGHPGANPEIFFHVSSVEGCIAPPVGCEVSWTVNVAVPPASVVTSSLVGVTVIPAVSLS